MDDKQRNRFTMLLATRDFLKKDEPIFGSNPTFKSGFVALDGALPKIETLIKIQEIDLRGHSEAKKEKSHILVHSAVPICKEMVAYAFAVNNDVLRQEINFSKSALQSLAAVDLPPTIQLIIDRATENLAALAPYGIEAPMLTILDTYNADFRDSISDPRQAIVGRKTVTEKLDEALDEAVAICKEQLDNLIYIYETSHPEFYKGYKSVRIIIDLHGKTKKTDPKPDPNPTPDK